jgi:hypothetical protein
MFLKVFLLEYAGSSGERRRLCGARHQALMILSDLAALCFAAAHLSARLVLRLR